MPQFKKAFLDLATHQAEQTPPPDTPLQGLPLVEVPAASGTASDTLALMVTGDGGWAGLDQGVAAELSRAGVAVIGLNSLKYFWTPRDATTTARDMERIARLYLTAWNKRRLLLIGYSFGADVLPFAVEKFPADLQQRVALMTLIGPDDTATFEFHVSDWIGGSFAERGEPLRPVLERLRGTPPTLCIYGVEETHSLCRSLAPASVKSVEVKGAHHYGGDYAGLARQILDALKQ
jgi:type IV secretory pathway VirJ component